MRTTNEVNHSGTQAQGTVMNSYPAASADVLNN